MLRTSRWSPRVVASVRRGTTATTTDRKKTDPPTAEMRRLP